mgnify:CR=1 FL=1
MTQPNYFEFIIWQPQGLTLDCLQNAQSCMNDSL